MLIARLFDGISDVLFAALIDRCHMKLGKVRPWFMISAPLLGIGLYASFHVPHGLGEQAKIIYIFITYTFVAAVAFTIYNLAFSAILPLMTLDADNRNAVATFGRFATRFGITVINYVTPILLAMWGGEKNTGAWNNISTLYAVLCTVLVFMMGVVIQEKEFTEVGNVAESTEKVQADKGSFIENLKVVLSTKYTWLLIILFTVFYFNSGTMAARAYYYRVVLGDLSLFSVGSMLATLPSLFLLPMMPYIFKKVEQRKAILISMAIYIAASVFWTIVPRNVTVAYACTVIIGLAWTPLLAVLFVFVADVDDYILLKQKKHVEHVVGMTSSIGTKIGTGLGSAVIGWGLSMFGYIGTQEIQTTGAETGIIGLTTVLPIIGAVIIMIIIALFDVNKQKAKLLEENQ